MTPITKLCQYIAKKLRRNIDPQSIQTPKVRYQQYKKLLEEVGTPMNSEEVSEYGLQLMMANRDTENLVLAKEVMASEARVHEVRMELVDLTMELKELKMEVGKCEQCLMSFGVEEKRVPKVLACGHTICTRCAIFTSITSTTEDDDKFIRCPFDNKPTFLKEGQGIEDLPTNKVLLRIAQREAERQRETEV